MSIELDPIGFVSTDAKTVPRSWAVSDVEGDLVSERLILELELTI